MLWNFCPAQPSVPIDGFHNVHMQYMWWAWVVLFIFMHTSAQQKNFDCLIRTMNQGRDQTHKEVTQPWLNSTCKDKWKVCLLVNLLNMCSLLADLWCHQHTTVLLHVSASETETAWYNAPLAPISDMLDLVHTLVTYKSNSKGDPLQKVFFCACLKHFKNFGECWFSCMRIVVPEKNVQKIACLMLCWFISHWILTQAKQMKNLFVVAWAAWQFGPTSLHSAASVTISFYLSGNKTRYWSKFFRKKTPEKTGLFS